MATHPFLALLSRTAHRICKNFLLFALSVLALTVSGTTGAVAQSLNASLTNASPKTGDCPVLPLVPPREDQEPTSASDLGAPVQVTPRWHRGLLLFEGDDGRRFSAHGLEVLKPAAEDAPLTDPTATFLALPAGPANRWGIAPAWIWTGSGRLLQKQALYDGHALLRTDRTTGACRSRLLAMEDTARRHRRGIWGKGLPFATGRPGAILSAQGRYVLIEGPLLSLGNTPTTRYLNFGTDWAQDLTATVASQKLSLFRETLERLGHYLEYRERVMVRLRGIVRERNGPLIELTSPDQLEILEDTKDAE